MSKITDDQLNGLLKAVKNGTGLGMSWRFRRFI